VQDGHRIEKIRPPRDLQSWQQSPVAGILTDRPVVVADLAPAVIEQMLKAHPYERFPVVQGGQPTGILTRKEAQAALTAKRAPKLEPVATCAADQTIRELQTLLINSTTQFVVVLDDHGAIQGVITLHDLLRAEVQKADS
jgi:CIC family chloride channel protein